MHSKCAPVRYKNCRYHSTNAKYVRTEIERSIRVVHFKGREENGLGFSNLPRIRVVYNARRRLVECVRSLGGVESRNNYSLEALLCRSRFDRARLKSKKYFSKCDQNEERKVENRTFVGKKSIRGRIEEDAFDQ